MRLAVNYISQSLFQRNILCYVFISCMSNHFCHTQGRVQFDSNGSRVQDRVRLHQYRMNHSGTFPLSTNSKYKERLLSQPLAISIL